MKKNKSLKQVIRDRYKDFPSEFTDTPTKELAETLIKKNKLKNPADVVASEIRVFMSTNNIKKAKKIGGEVGKGSLSELLKQHRALDTEHFDSTSSNVLAGEIIEKYGLKKERANFAGEIRIYKSNNGISTRKIFDFGIAHKTKQDRTEEKKDKTEIFRLKQLLQLDDAVDFKGVYSIPERHSASTSEATAVLMYSDLHVEERIELSTTNGLNEYNPDIAKKRSDRFFINAPKLIESNRKNVKISDVVLMLLGDNIHGWIHEEFQTTNWLKPMEATLYAETLIISGINKLLEDKFIKNLTVVCKVGNHSRMTDKVYGDNEALLSFEYILYKHLERYFSSEKRVKFLIDNSYFTYLKIYDFVNRCHHGHIIRFAGGIGGLTVPLIKAVLRANEQIKADFDWMGHFHSRMALPNVFINGSICGFNGYAARKGFRPDRAVQSFALIDKVRGATVTAPIFLE